MRPLTPAKAADIIRHKFSNRKDVKRGQINLVVKNTYEGEVGTENAKYGQPFEKIITRALGLLKKNGEATNVDGYGYWDFENISDSEMQIEDFSNEPTEELLELRKIKPNKIIGQKDATKTVYILLPSI